MKPFTRAVLGVLLLLLHPFAISQDFPDRPVRLVVVDPPGSAVDIVARLISEQLVGKWPQRAVVENRPGASGTIAANQVAKAKPDGYTYLMTGTFTEAIVPFAMQSMPYDYQKDLVPVAEVARLPFVLVSPADSKLRSLKDVEALSRSKPNGITVGGMPRGSSLHLTWEIIAQQLGIQSVYVAYNGGHQLQGDLVGGQLDMAIDTISSARPFIQNGRTHGMATTSRTRSGALPGVPTLDENGLQNMEVIVWVGVMAPNGTPADRLAIVEKAMIEAAQSDVVKTRLSEFGYIVTGRSGAQLGETIRQDRARFEPLVKRLGLKLN
jgi:tripartite-type tricarboxylate transporter receptor subunit TctC